MNAPLSPSILLNAVRQARLVREAETSLISFTQLVWDVIEPGVQFKDNWHLHAIAEHLEAITHGELENLIINIPPGCMKLCADSTVVPTPQGWKTHKDLQVGDQVFGPDGKPRNIIAVSPEGVADLEVVFSNGEVIKCNGDHLWTVFDRYGRKERTLSTRELKSKKLHEGGRSRFQVGDYEALEFAEKELLIHPYFLGCWLGDGTHNKPAITHHEDDVEHVAKLEALGYYVRVAHKTGPSTLCSSFTKQGVGKKLQALRVWKNKHIPDGYMHGSIEQRLELLAGLIDTDGHVDEAGRVLFSTCSDVLARQVEKLCFSLGFRVSVFSRSAPGYLGVSSSKTAYQLSFHPNRVIPTALPRKKVSRILALRRAVGICEIREAKNPEVGHCITVDRADGLYLVGTSCITTHNSILVSVAWPAWEWKDNPALRYLGASYGADLAVRDAAKTRDILFSPLYQQLWPKTQVKRGADNKLKYELTAGGWRIATSVGGRATGEHPDRKIVDDPHNAKQAESDAERAAALVWFDRTLSSRGKSRGAKTVVVMQRLHESDVTGHILAEKFDDYEHLCLPMTYEGRKFVTCIGWEDPRTVEGSLLWPEMFPQKSVNELTKLLGEYGTAGQLQQRPAPAGGGILKVKHFQLWPHDRELPVFEKVVQSYDGAYSEKEAEGNDPSACTVWGTFSHGKIRGAMLLDAWDDYLGYPQFRQKVIDEWHAVYGKTKDRKGRKSDVILVEKKSSGISILQDLRAAKIPAIPYDPGRADKVQRAHNVAPVLELDVLYIPESKKEPGKPVMWARKFLDQVEKFPNAEHDDYCVAEGTLIMMGDGTERCVEDVCLGDLVLTPAGPKKVLEARCTGIKPVYEVTAGGTKLLATGNHPLCLRKGVYAKIETLSQNQEVVWLSNAQWLTTRLRSWYFKGIGIAGTRMLRSRSTGSTSTALENFFTERFGSFTTGLSLAGTTSTISTKTRETTTSQTSSASRLNSTGNYYTSINKNITPLSSSWSIWRRFGKKPSIGTPPLREEHGTRLTPSDKLRRLRQKVFRTLESMPEGNAALSVSGVKGRVLSRVSGLCTALTAAGQRLLSSTVRVKVGAPTAEVRVYNLTVADEHCFYANRFLTHNCDTFTQCLILLRDEGWFELDFADDDPIEEAEYTKKVNPYG